MKIPCEDCISLPICKLEILNILDYEDLKLHSIKLTDRNDNKYTEMFEGIFIVVKSIRKKCSIFYSYTNKNVSAYNYDFYMINKIFSRILIELMEL